MSVEERMVAIGIFIQIYDKRFSEKEKIDAIKRVLELPSFGMVHKKDMLTVIEWLVERLEAANDGTS